MSHLDHGSAFPVHHMTSTLAPYHLLLLDWSGGSFKSVKQIMSGPTMVSQTPYISWALCDLVLGNFSDFPLIPFPTGLFQGLEHSQLVLPWGVLYLLLPVFHMTDFFSSLGF